MLWTSDEAAGATGGQALAPFEVSGVSIDTRSLTPGDLFVALSAARDGHDFVAQALANGAGGALVSHIPDGVADDAPLLLVEDVQIALEALGRAARARSDAKVVAVTGSVGKTSTKEMLRAMLGAQGQVHAAEKSYNNHWGVPLTLARLPQEADFAVIEIGMNHPGEIAPLARLARPDVALITTVAPAHLAAFDDLTGIAREKASIFEGLEPGGVAVYRGDIEVSALLAREAGAYCPVSFGEGEGYDHCARAITVHDDCTVVEAQADGQGIIYKVMAPGRHFALNALGALAVTGALGCDLALSIAGLARWSAGAGRGAREAVVLDPARRDVSLELIDDAYNANPASLAAALEVLAAATVRDGVGRIEKGRRIAYLGDMKELGAGGADLHRAIADLPAMQRIDTVHCIGPLMRQLWEALPESRRGRWSADAPQMVQGIARDLDAGDVVLAKGSLSMGLACVVDAIRKMSQAPADLDR